MMALLDPLLLVVTVAVLGGAQVVIGVVVPRIYRAASRAQESVGAMGAALERVLGALRTVKASGAEQREAQRVRPGGRPRPGRQACAPPNGRRWPATPPGWPSRSSFIVVLGLGGARVASGAIDVGTLVAFLLYLFYLMPPMQGLVGRGHASTRSAPPRSPASARPSSLPGRARPRPGRAAAGPAPRPPRSPSTRCASATATSCPRSTAASASASRPAA